METIQNIDKLIGRAVLSLETANKLGEVNDLFVDPQTGRLAGMSVKRPDESSVSVEHREIHSIGPDAVMISQDDSLVPPEQFPLKHLPLAKNQLIGVKVITEGGQLVGNIANLFIWLTEMPAFIYEVRSSIFDKLLGHAFYFPASVGCVLASDQAAVVISGGTETMERSLDAVSKRLLAPREVQAYRPGGIHVTVRSHSD